VLLEPESADVMASGRQAEKAMLTCEMDVVGRHSRQACSDHHLCLLSLHIECQWLLELHWKSRNLRWNLRWNLRLILKLNGIGRLILIGTVMLLVVRVGLSSTCGCLMLMLMLMTTIATERPRLREHLLVVFVVSIILEENVLDED